VNTDDSLADTQTADRAEQRARYVRQVVDEAPPLTADQRAALSVLLLARAERHPAGIMATKTQAVPQRTDLPAGRMGSVDYGRRRQAL
jgi:hypothetical protein